MIFVPITAVSSVNFCIFKIRLWLLKMSPGLLVSFKTGFYSLSKFSFLSHEKKLLVETNYKLSKVCTIRA